LVMIAKPGGDLHPSASSAREPLGPAMPASATICHRVWEQAARGPSSPNLVIVNVGHDQRRATSTLAPSCPCTCT
jgi:hypothetical protein